MRDIVNENVHQPADPVISEVLAKDHLYIAWIGFQRRPLSMQSYVGYDLVHIPPPFSSRWAKPFGYVIQAMRTVAITLRRKPDVLWFQSPPSFIVYLAYLLKKMSGGRLRVVADCHNGSLDPRLQNGRWTNLPKINALMNRFDVVLAHNAEVGEIAARRGIDRDRLLVLETRPAPLPVLDTPPDVQNPVALIPCSFQQDEPIEALLEAAGRVPHVTFKLTGNKAKAAAAGWVARAPENVVFTGFLSKKDYTDLLVNADLVIGLTTVDGIQLSAANEAVGAGRPLLLSDTSVLRDLFGNAAVFAENTGPGLADGVSQAVARLHDLAQASRALKATREARWRKQADICLSRLT